MKKKGKALYLIAVTAILAACTVPISEEVVLAVEDTHSPRISFTSHEEHDVFFSSLVLSGEVIDDVREEGDGKGLLRRLAISLGKSNAEKGAITISSTGEVTRNPSEGDLDIQYSDGKFSVVVENAGELGTRAVVLVTAEDTIGNQAEEDLTLLKNTGPVIKFNNNDRNPYYSKTDYTVSAMGTIQDSADISGSVEHISKIVLRVDLDYDNEVEFDIKKGPSEVGVGGERIWKDDNHPNYDFKLLDGNDFSITVPIPVNVDGEVVGGFNVLMRAEDTNGIEDRKTLPFSVTTGKPKIEIHSPSRVQSDKGIYYSSDGIYYKGQTGEPDKLEKITIAAKIFKKSYDVTHVIFSLSDGNPPNYAEIELSDKEINAINGKPTIISKDFSFDDVGAEITAVDNLTIAVTAEDARGQSTTATRKASKDTTPPNVDFEPNVDFNWSDDDQEINGSYFAKSSDDVKVEFTLSDDGSGVGGARYDGTELNDNDAGVYSWTPVKGNADSDGISEVDLSKLVAYDNLQNERRPLSGTLYYYNLPASLPDNMSVSKVDNKTESNNNFLWDGDEIKAEFTSKRHLDLDGTKIEFFSGGVLEDDKIGSVTFDKSGPSDQTYTYTAEYTVENDDKDGEISWKLHYKDLAGNEETYDGPKPGLTIDNTDPSIENVSFFLSSGETGVVTQNNNRGEIKFEVTGTDIEGGLVIFKVKNDTASEHEETPTPTEKDGEWTAETNAIGVGKEGTLEASITVTDKSGRTATKTTDLTTVDTKGPTVSTYSSPSSQVDGSKYGIGDVIEFKLTLDEAQKDDVTPTAHLHVGGEELEFDLSTDGERRTWTAKYTVLEAGDTIPSILLAASETYELKGDFTDQYGNKGEISIKNPGLTIDNVKPVVIESGSTQPFQLRGVKGRQIRVVQVSPDVEIVELDVDNHDPVVVFEGVTVEGVNAVPFDPRRRILLPNAGKNVTEGVGDDSTIISKAYDVSIDLPRHQDLIKKEDGTVTKSASVTIKLKLTDLLGNVSYTEITIGISDEKAGIDP